MFTFLFRFQFWFGGRGDSTVHEQNDSKRKAELELPLICSAELKIRSFVFVVSDLTDDSSSPVKSSVSGLVFCLKTESVQSVLFPKTKWLSLKALAAAGSCVRWRTHIATGTIWEKESCDWRKGNRRRRRRGWQIAADAEKQRCCYCEIEKDKIL